MARKKLIQEIDEELEDEDEVEELSSAYEVAPGGVVHHHVPKPKGGYKRVVLREGYVVKASVNEDKTLSWPDGFDEGMIRSLLATGHLVEHDSRPRGRGKRRRVVNPRLPGVPEQPVLPSEQDVSEKPVSSKVSASAVEAAAKAGIEKARQVQKEYPKGKWTVDPASLEGKPLNMLNAMIKDRDKAAPTFKTVEEASAFLSQDRK